MITNHQTIKKKQNGIALLMLVIIIAIIFSVYYFSSISVVNIKVTSIENTRSALKQAKQALINYAVMHADGASSGNLGEYGYLPCPHIKINSPPEEGEQQIPNCGGGGLNSIGYLPWKTLGYGVFSDSSGNCLWYAVSSSYKNATYSGLINEDSNGMFQIVDKDGTTIAGNDPKDRIVAIIFAPGPALGTQARVFDKTTICGDDGTNVSAYLEGNGATDNATLDGGVDKLDKFIHASLMSDTEVTPYYNDHFITITRDEIWQNIVSRSDFNTKIKNLTEALALCLSKYATTVGFVRLPWPAPMGLLDYRDELKYEDTGVFAGRFPYKVANSNTAITGSFDDKLFTQGACDDLGGALVDLEATGEYRSLWDNWKDHFFYVVSDGFSPDASNGACGVGDCIKYGSDDMAAIVIYSGSREGTQLRTGSEAGDTDTKNSIDNYIENNVPAFNSGTGTASYVAGENDFMYCIKPDLSVAECEP